MDRLKEVVFLEHVLEQKVKEAVIDCPLARLTPEIVATLEAHCAQHKGKAAVKFRIRDETEDILLASRTVLVRPQAGMFAEFRRLGFAVTLS